VLTSTSHAQGWGRTDCLVCHQPGLLAGHAGLQPEQCLGCHGDNGTQPGYRRCLVCHGNPPASAAHARHLALAGLGVGCDTCHQGAGIDGSSRHRDGTVEVVFAARFGGSWNGAGCSGVWCHGSGSPSWHQTGPLGCRECHDPAQPAAIGPRSGKHAVHVALTGVTCATCHPAAPSTHFNGQLDNPSPIRPDGGSYHDDTPTGFNPSGSSGSCSGMSSPCHGLQARWTVGEACGACHGATRDAPPSSGSHVRHAAAGQLDFACTICHARYPADHIDGQVEVAIDATVVPGGGQYAGGRCADLYCHGGGPDPLTGGTNTTPTWGQPATAVCGSCHGATASRPPSSGSHDAHASATGRGYPCTFCHPVYPRNHVDFHKDVVFSGVGLPGHGRYVSGTCADVYCHGGGTDPLPPAGGANTTPRWGDPTAATCGACHGAPGGPTGYPPTGQHPFHITIAGAICSDCHAAWPVGHVDGVRTVVFDPAFPDAGYTPEAVPNEGTCSRVGCHWDYPSDVRSWKP